MNDRRPVFDPMRGLLSLVVVACMLLPTGSGVVAQQTENRPGQQAPAKRKKKKKKQSPFQWVNPIHANLKKQLPASVSHQTFKSSSLGQDVGYCIYLPPQYNQPEYRDRRFPVVYYLHGGRPGNETKSVRLTKQLDRLARTEKLDPVIYVFVNGGPVSHYNMPDKPEAQGADVFIKELIPHIDKTYRTVADRNGRGIEGFSQGGRGTARLMFRYPELFCSASPGGGGHATEKRISESGGFENEKLKFGEGDNTWDLAKAYAKRRKDQPDMTPPLSILVHVGDEGFNFQNNLEWMKHLTSLDIDHQKVIVPGVGHSASGIYEKSGLKLIKFHLGNFAMQRPKK